MVFIVPTYLTVNLSYWTFNLHNWDEKDDDNTRVFSN